MKMKRLYASIGALVLFSALSATSIAAQDKDDTTKSTTDEATSKSHPSAKTASTLQGVLLSSDTIIGVTVRNQHGEDVGSIERLLINPKTGLVSYAVLGVGGFLGVGEKSIMVPWRALEIARAGDSLVLKTSKQLLKHTPESTTMPNPDKKG